MESYEHVTEMECLICHECLVHDPKPPDGDDHQPNRIVFEPSERCSMCQNLTHTYCLSLWFDNSYPERCPHCRAEVTEDCAFQIIEAGQGGSAAENWINFKILQAELERLWRNRPHDYADESEYDSEYGSSSEPAPNHEVGVESEEEDQESEGEMNDEMEVESEEENQEYERESDDDEPEAQSLSGSDQDEINSN